MHPARVCLPQPEQGAEERAVSEPVVLPDSLTGERLDRVVALLLACTRAAAAALLDGGAVWLNGAVVRTGSTRVKGGDLLEVVATPAPRAKRSDPVPEEGVPLCLVAVDDDIIVVDKPAGLVVHPGAGNETGTLVAGLLARFPELAELPRSGFGTSDRPGIVHRLDKDTSGLLVVARSPRSFESLSSQVASHTMERTYRALVAGVVAADSGRVDAPIGRSERQRTAMAISQVGRESRTNYRVLARYEQPLPASLLEVTLETGRTHQIRVHLAAIGHPILGDSRYTPLSRRGRPSGAEMALLPLRRPFLHAAALELSHPSRLERARFVSPLPPELATTLSYLEEACSHRES